MIAVVNDPEGVNLRGGPGTEFNSLGVVAMGTELPVLGPKQNVNWLPVSYQGRLGFVHADYVDLRTSPAAGSASSATPTASPSPRPSPSSSPSPSASPSPSSSPSSQQMRVTSPDGVNLRAGPSMSAPVITAMPNNARVTVIGRSPDGKWVNVRYNGQTGWADAEYLAPVDDRSGSASTSSAGGSNPGSAAGSARFIWPVSGRSITTPFSGGHPGIDIDQFPSGGNPVVATAAGRVSFAGGNPCCSYGLRVEVTHRDGSMALYAHLRSIDVREGQEVAQGQTLGKSGSTGYSTGAHLHFELHMGGTPVDPLGLLPR